MASCDTCDHLAGVERIARRQLGRLMDLYPERYHDDQWATLLDALVDVDAHRAWHRKRSEASKLAAANRHAAARPAAPSHA